MYYRKSYKTRIKNVINISRCTLFFLLSAFVLQVKGQTGTSLSENKTPGSLLWPSTRKDYIYSVPSLGSLSLTPSNIQTSYVYDPVKGEFVLRKTAGSINLIPEYRMGIPEFQKQYNSQVLSKNWAKNISRYQQNLTGSDNAGLASASGRQADPLQNLFGPDFIRITPQGSAEMIMKVNTTKTDNPNISEAARKTSSFDFDQNIQMNVTGSIADRVNMEVRYDSKSVFDFENEIKMDYTGKEDEIIKKIEVGNVSFPLSGSLINGSHNLFGVKSELQFGKLTVTSVFSKQNGETSVTTMQGGAMSSKYEIPADQFEENKHFFLSQYFRDKFETAMASLPVITSDIVIDRIEVWITNKTSNYENSRNILAAVDMGEPGQYIYNNVPEFVASPGQIYPGNSSNNMYNALTSNYTVRDISQITSSLQPLTSRNFRQGQDYEKVENARLLTEQEYSLNRSLGFISLRAPLNADEVLAVAFEYTVNGTTYRVGELSTSGIATPQTLVVKLLKGTNLSPRLPTWKLMLRNIYNLGTYPVNKDKFQLHVLYNDPKSGNPINYLPEETLKNELLIRMMKLDRLNQNNDPAPDGVFDFVNGGTIKADEGLIIFPVLEPFGSNLRKELQARGLAEADVRKYVFTELYDSTLVRARQVAERNRFSIGGTYVASTGSSIQLNAMQVSPGSVKVTAGGQPLVENVDFIVDYATGKVSIINQNILDSGVPIQTISEDNSTFSMQTKTLIGTHLDYKFNRNLRLGATIMNYTEKPLTQKVTIGDEALSNTMWGLSADYSVETPGLTRLLNKALFRKTDAMSSVSIFAEMAQLLPGSANSVQKKGTAYIDDFESSKTSVNLLTWNQWKISSIPEGQPFLTEASLTNNLNTGKNRSRLAWYVIDPLFVNPNYFSSSTPAHIRNNPDTRSSHFVKQIEEQNIFKNKENPNGMPSTMQVLNVAFYPNERGPYNFDDTDISSDGSLSRPETRWGGMMRALPVTDFESSNIEFVEFWVMDPFVEDTGNTMTGGDLYINLGDVSEDILKDSRKFFENGLTAGGVDYTTWGKVPTTQSLVNAFSGDMENRVLEDVGLDGLNSAEEASFFSSFLDEARKKLSQAPMKILEDDPSSDNFRFYRGAAFDAEERGILDRYKYYNLPEGNSSARNEYATSIPDSEDINGDNTLNENENFYQYKISIRPKDLARVGDNFITDIVTDKTRFPNGDTSSVRWFQIRIPLTRFEKTVGSISDFRSIRFMRMYMHGFKHPVILRFAKMELVRGEWRRYTQNLRSPGEIITSPELSDAILDIGTVNIEENSGKQPIGYQLPPGFERTIDQASNQRQRQNEQSLLLKVTNLSNGDARATYRNILYDLRRHRHLQMEVHAEQVPGHLLYDGEVSLFLRIGTDFKNNYYEYEIPLMLTPWGSIDRNEIWPEKNRLDIDLRTFTDVKQARNDAMRKPGSGVTLATPFKAEIDGKNIYVTGNPNLGEIKTIMIGVRYPASAGRAGEKRSVEVWVNELRMSNFDGNSGWAANARMNVQLADIGSVNFMAEKSTPGFGAINQKVNNRSTENHFAYNIASNLELGRFLPEKTRLEIPFYVSFGESISDPEYDPIDPDILLKDKLRNAGNKSERDSIKRYSQDYQKNNSITFSNVRYTQNPEKEARMWSPSNLSFNYSLSETYSRNPNTEYNRNKQTSGGFMYSYSVSPDFFAPFEESSALSRPSFAFIKDFNVNYMPTSLMFRTDYNRMQSEIRYRDINNPYNLIIPIENELYTNTRLYQWAHDITKSINLNFSATNIERLDDTDIYLQDYMKTYYELFRDDVNRTIRRQTNTTQYYHDLRLNYNIPINKIPIFDWTSLSLGYAASYGWDVGPLMPEEISIGNTIKNSRTIQLTGLFSFTTLYDKIPALRKFNAPKSNEVSLSKTELFTKENVTIKAGEKTGIFHQLGSKSPKLTVTSKSGQRIDVDFTVASANRIVITSKEDLEDVKIIVAAQIDEKDFDIGYSIYNSGLRLVSMLKTVSLSVSETNGLNLPGYMPITRIAGMDGSAPGLGFILGAQDRDFAAKAAANGWLSKSQMQNMPFIITQNRLINIGATLEPVKNLRIDLTGNRATSGTTREYYTANSAGIFLDNTRNRRDNGNFSMTFIAIGSSFEKLKTSNNFHSDTYEKFKSYRTRIAARLANDRVLADPSYNPNSDPVTGLPITDGSKNGYGLNSQNVLIPAFMAAYGGMSPEKVTLSRFPSLRHVRPNWYIEYDGLMNLDLFKNLFRSFVIKHSYKATYSVGNYQTNIDYSDISAILSNVRDIQNNFIPKYDISGITITENIGPLGSLDMIWKNNITNRIGYTTSRILNLSLTNLQLTESRTEEITLGMGYRVDAAKIFVPTFSGRTKKIENTLIVNADFSIRNNRQIIRRLNDDIPMPGAGQKITTLKLSADLQVMQNLNVRAFYDRTINTPFISTSFPVTNANVGASLLFRLMQQ